MPDSKRVLQYVYSRLMTHKGGNFNEFTQLDNPWLPRFLTKQPINPGQLISLELHRWCEAKDKKPGNLPYPQVIAFLLEKFMIKSTEEADNVKCLPIGSMNLGKMDIKYDKPAKPTRSGSQAGCASHTTVPSASGAGDQEVDSHASPSRAPRVSAAMKGLVEEMKNELLFKMPDPLMAPLRAECDAAFQQQEQRIQGLEDRLGRVEAKLDLILSHFQIPQP